MAKRIKKSERLPEDRPAALGELIHAQVRGAIETAVHEGPRRAPKPPWRSSTLRFVHGL